MYAISQHPIFAKNCHMPIAIWADEDSWKELGINESKHMIRVEHNSLYSDESISGFIQLKNYDETDKIPVVKNKPYLVNDVLLNSSSLNNPDIFPFNGWRGFVEKENWEIAGEASKNINELLSIIGKKPLKVPPIPGMVSPRVIAMMINEAWFALAENVSSKTDIDTAMKLGTNYPYGPFEWGERIGLKNIYRLLKQLELSDPIYAPAPLLTKEAGS